MPSLLVQALNDPCREIHVHALGLVVGPARLGPVDCTAHILTGVELLVKFSCLHGIQSPLLGRGAPR